MHKNSLEMDPVAAAARKVDAATLLDSAMNGFFLSDRRGRLVQCNRACLEMLGFDEEDFIGKTVHDLDVAYSAAEIDQMIEATAEQGHLKGETRIRTGHGPPIDVAFLVTYVPTDDTGCFFGFFEDITERKRAERALRESETRWRNLAEGVNAALFIYQDGRLVYANEFTSRMTGYSQAELIGMPVEDLMISDYAALYEQRVLQLKQRGATFSPYRAPLRTKTGKRRWASVSLSPSSFNQRPAFIGVGFDITDQILADEALGESRKELQALGLEISRVESLERRELGSLLHDGLVQDLAACRLQLDGLRKGLRAEEERVALATALGLIDRAIRQSRELVQDLALPVLHEFGIDAALAELCKQRLSDQGPTISFETDEIPKPLDEELLVVTYRAAQELLRNIGHHAEASHVTVRSAREGQYVVITVRDDGQGFDPTNLRKTVYGKGRGLGLFLISKRARHLGGTFNIQSQPGAGTEVRMALPLQRTRTSPSALEEEIAK